jgi:NitT/TauT family transport system substrate-binding protein
MPLYATIGHYFVHGLFRALIIHNEEFFMLGNRLSVFVKKSLAGLGLLALAAAAPAETIVKVGIVNWVGFAGFFVAEKNDSFKPHQVKVQMKLYTDNSAMIAGFDKGEVDTALLTYEPVIEAVANGKDWKVVLPVDYSNGGDAIVSLKTIKQVSDLKGKTIGLDLISPSAILLDYALLKNNIQPADVKTVSMSPDQVPGAMESARIQAGVTYEPNISNLVAAAGGQKFHVLYSSKDAPGLITDVLVAKAPYIQANRDALIGLIKGYRDALAQFQAGDAKAGRAVASTLGVSQAELKEQLALVHIPTLEEMAVNFTPSDNINSFFTNGKIIADVLIARGKIKAAPEIANTLDDTPAQAAMAK